MVQTKSKITWSKEAERMRRELVAAGARPVFNAVEGWLAANEHLWARAFVFTDPESDERWDELVVEVAVEVDLDRTLELWSDVADVIQQAEKQLDDALRERLATEFAVHLAWGALVDRSR